jgi:hypothetical protein
MDNRFWIALLITSAGPLLLTIICLVSAGLAVVRQGDLGGAGLSAGLGFASLAGAFAIQVGILYLSLSAAFNHEGARAMAGLIGICNLVENVLKAGGLVLVGMAVFQRRPAERHSG